MSLVPTGGKRFSVNTAWGSWGRGWRKDHEGRWLVKLANDRGHKKGDTFYLFIIFSGFILFQSLSLL